MKKIIKPNTGKAKTTTTDVEFAFDTVAYSLDQDGWGEFTTDMLSNVTYHGIGGDYYQHNKGQDFVQRIYRLDGLSPEHSSIINGKILYTCGSGLDLGEKPPKDMVAFFDNSPELLAEQAKVDLGGAYAGDIRSEAMAGKNLNELTKLIAKDLVQLGGSYVLLYIAGDKISKQIHVPFHTVFKAKKKDGDIDGLNYYYITENGKVDDQTPRVQQFSPRHLDQKVQLVDLRLPHCADTMYAHPDYVAAMKWILLDGYIADFFNSFAERNYWLGGYIKTGKNPPKEQKSKVQADLNNQFGGMKKAGTWAYIWGADDLTEIVSFPINSSDDLFVHQQQWISAKIRTAHKVTEPALLGLPAGENSTSVFAAKDQLKTALIVWQNTSIAPIQFAISDWYNEVLRFNGVKDTVTIKAFNPFHESNESKDGTNKLLNEGEGSAVTGPVAALDGTTEGTTTTTAGTVQDTALNGAQAAEARATLKDVGLGLLSKETATALLQACYPAMSRDLIKIMIDGVKPINTPTA